MHVKVPVRTNKIDLLWDRGAATAEYVVATRPLWDSPDCF